MNTARLGLTTVKIVVAVAMGGYGILKFMESHPPEWAWGLGLVILAGFLAGESRDNLRTEGDRPTTG